MTMSYEISEQDYHELISDCMDAANGYAKSVMNFEDSREQIYWHDIFVAKLGVLLLCNLISYDAYAAIYNQFHEIAYKERSEEIHKEWSEKLKAEFVRLFVCTSK